MGITSIGSMGGVNTAAASAAAGPEVASAGIEVSVLEKTMDTQEALAQTLISQLTELPSKVDMSV